MTSMSESRPFWEQKTLAEMSSDEWESICDGCAKCCLTQLQDQDSEQLVFTDVACDLLNDNTCLCSDYENRSKRVPSCITMNPDNVKETSEFAPPTCAYRLLVQGDELPNWHHLKSGAKKSVHERGQSVRHRVRFQSDINEDDIQDYIVEWPALDGHDKKGF